MSTPLKRTITTFLILIVLFLNPSCYSVKPGVTKSGKNLYETFFLGEEGKQFFIKPLRFNNGEGGVIMIDFTFRRGNNSNPSAAGNFTLLSQLAGSTAGYYSPDEYPLDSIGISNGDAVYLLRDLARLYSARYRKYSDYRFSSRLPYRELHSFVASETKNIIMSIVVTNSKTLHEIQRAFQEKFSLLKLEFYINTHHAGEGSTEHNKLNPALTIGELRNGDAVTEFSIHGNLKTSTLEETWQETFGFSVQVFRKSGNVWLQTTSTDDWTLSEQQQSAEEYAKPL